MRALRHEPQASWRCPRRSSDRSQPPSRGRACHSSTFNETPTAPTQAKLIPSPAIEIGCCRFRSFFKCRSRVNPTSVGGGNKVLGKSGIQTLEDDRRVGATEAERVGQYTSERHVVATLADDRHVGKLRIEVFDIGAFADEAAIHHQQGVDSLLRAGGAE